MLDQKDILSTLDMIDNQHLDIRTITMGISLLDCRRNTDRETAEAVYEKVTRLARNLVRVGCELESELGVPIVNKRISVTPVSMISGSDPAVIAVALDKAAAQVGGDVALLQHTGGLEGHHGGGSGHGGLAAIGI